MRVVFFSDTHLGFDLPVRPRTARVHRGEDFFANFERVLRYAESERVDLVLHGGDLFFRSRVPPAIVDRVYQRLARFVSSGIPLGVIAGNHERSALPASLLLRQPGLHEFAEASTVAFELAGGRLAVTGVPFVGDARAFARQVERAGTLPADAHLLLAHEAFLGAAVEGFVFGDRADTVRPAELPDRFDAILTGHIHRHQVLWHRRPSGARLPIAFAGSVERTSYAERDEVKGFVELTLTPGAASRGRLRFHPLPTTPLPTLPPGWQRGASDEADDADAAYARPASPRGWRWPR